MNRPLGCLFAVIISLYCAAGACGDIPVDGILEREPVPAEAKTAPLAVRVDHTAEQATIRIPERFLHNGAGANNGAALPKTRTIAAGLAMSLAVSAAFFLRRRGPVKAAAITAVAVAAMLGVWSAVYANIAPPPEYEEPIIRQIDEQAALVSGEVKIEVVPTGEAVLLVLPARLIPEEVPAPPELAPAIEQGDSQ